MGERKELEDGIRKRLQCTEQRAAEIAERMEDLSKPLRPLLEDWLQTGGEDSDALYEGWSLNTLKREFRMKFTGALITLDWLLKEPEEAKKALDYGIR